MENIILHVDCKGEALRRVEEKLTENNKYYMGMKKEKEC